MAGLTLNKVEYGRLLAERIPLKVESDADYGRLADEVEQITFDEAATRAERRRRLGTAAGGPGLTPGRSSPRRRKQRLCQPDHERQARR